MLNNPDETGLAPPWDPFVGLARTLLAAASAATLLASPPAALFAAASGLPRAPACHGVFRAAAFCLGRQHLNSTRILAGVCLLIVASGWRPAWTAVPHWYLSWSIFATVTLQDGGDQVTAVLTVLSLPLFLTDRRRWHWARVEAGPPRLLATVARSSRWICALQVAGIYAQSGVAKLGRPDWVNGTAMWYWAQHEVFGFPGALHTLAITIFSWPIGVALLTWGPILLEVTLALSLVRGPRARVRLVLFLLGATFHLGIILFMGLTSFGTAMLAALLFLLTRPEDRVNFKTGWYLRHRRVLLALESPKRVPAEV